MALDYNNIQTQKLDYYLWFWKKDNIFDYKMYNLAVTIGELKAEEIDLNLDCIEQSLLEYGVEKINDIPAALADNLNEKAYYIEGEGVYWNREFSTNLLKKLNNEYPDIYLDKVVIDNSILLHEFFHFLEFRDKSYVHQYIKNVLGINCPEIYREIAAFSFVNSILEYKCQIIDLVWLKVNAPTYYKKIRTELERVA